MTGHVANSYPTYKPHFLFLSQNPKSSWDSQDSRKPRLQMKPPARLPSTIYTGSGRASHEAEYL